MMTTIFDGMNNNLDEIIYRLGNGEVGIFPCDTIYGICSILGDEQKNRILKIKERSLNKSFISLVSIDYIRSSKFEVPEKFLSVWPAPLTLIVYDDEKVTHGIRVPKDNNILKILSVLGAIYSTSVNISTKSSLLTFDEIFEEFNNKVDFIVKEDTQSSVPSTILDVTKTPYQVIRQGAFDLSTIL